MSNISIQVEAPSLELFEEAMGLAKAHYEEVESKSDKLPFKFEPKVIETYISLGLLEVVTVRVGGELLGYFANVIQPEVFSEHLKAQELGIYLHPSVRRAGVCKRLFEVMEDHLRSIGVELQLVMFKHGHNDKLPLRLGYEVTEVVYQKIL